MMMTSESTNPVMTHCGMYLISLPTLQSPMMSWKIPAKNTAANKYSVPYSAMRATTTSAIEPAPADTMAGRPPRNADKIRNATEVYSPSIGLTPAMMVKPTTSGMTENADTSPPRKSSFGLSRHWEISFFMSEFNFFSLKCDVGVRLVCWRRSLGLLPLARGTATSRPIRTPRAIILFLSGRRKGGHQEIPGKNPPRTLKKLPRTVLWAIGDSAKTSAGALVRFYLQNLRFVKFLRQIENLQGF